MCKNPAECKPIEESNEAAQDDNGSEDDDDFDEDGSYDSDDCYSETSSDHERSDSESDAESSSGNRVSPDMVLLLMLKEKGAITEEKYNEKAEKCPYNFKSIIPRLPRSLSVDTIDYTKDLSEAEDFNDDNENASKNGDNIDNTGINAKTLESQSDFLSSDERLNHIEKNFDIIDGTAFPKNNVTEETINKNGCTKEATLTEQLKVHVETNKRESEVDTVIKGNQALLKSNHKEFSQKEQEHTVDRESVKLRESSEDNGESSKGDEEGHTNRENTPTKLEQDMEVNHKQSEVDEEMQDAPAILGTNQKELHHEEHKTAVVESVKSHEISEGHAVSKKGDENSEGNTYNGNTPAKKHESEVNEEVQEAQALTFKESVQSHENSEDSTVTAESNIYVYIYEHTMYGHIKKVKEVICTKDVYDSQILVEDRNITGDKENITLSEDNVIVIENKSMETYVDSQDTTKQDTTSEKSQDECQKENRNTNKESTSATGKITKTFQYIITKLAREYFPKEDEDDRLSFDYGEDYAHRLLSYANCLDSNYENNTALNKYDEKYDDDEDWNLREFAFFLNFYSPSSYKYILETYNTPLPGLKVLYSWYMKDDDSPGLTGRAFKILKEKSKVKRQTCALMFIDVYLKNDEYGDQVDYGNGEHCSFGDRAVLVYVFVLVSLDEDWKMPIGYIYARNVPAETQAELVRICLTHCHDAGADVVAVTMDTPEPADLLGCNFNFGNPRNLKTTFKHPSCNRDVAVWIDPCLALKSTRQLLKVKGVLRDNDDNKIRWSLIRSLRKLQSDFTSDDFTELENPEFFPLRNHIAKSGLTTETFSQTLVPAIRLGQQLVPEIFNPDTEPTVRYITVINELYNVLNTRTIANFDEVKKQLYAAKKYLIAMFFNENNAISLFDKDNLNWKRLQGYRYFLKDEPVCGIIAFLICIESFKHLHVTLVQKNIINCLNPKRLSKEHAENFVANLRAYYSDLDPQNLSGEKFQSFYQNLFDELEKNPKFSGKSVSLEHWHLQDRYAPAVTIKLTSGKRSYDDVYSGRYKLKKLKKTTDIEDATKLLREYSKALDVEIDLSTRKNMVGYLAGWIAAKFARSIRCEACIDALCSDRKLWFHKFITFKRIYALCLPSEELFRVCWEVEKTLRFKRNPASVRAWVVRSLSQKFPWGSRTVPQSQQHHLYHRGLLARAVLAKYTALRVPAPFSKKDTAKIVENYQRFTIKDPDDSYDELAEWLNPTEDLILPAKRFNLEV